MTPWRIVFMGTPGFAVGALRALCSGPDAVVGVFTQADKPAGRGMQRAASPVKQAALELGLPVFQPQRLRAPEAVAELAALRPDLVVVAAYGQILSSEVLNLPAHGCINIHASLLPRWRGAAPIQRAILAGDAESGVSIMQMDEGLDTGDVLAMRALPIGERMTGGALHDGLAELGAALLLETIAGMHAGTIHARRQPDEGVTYAKKLTRDDELLDWGLDAEDVCRRIRAMSPWPGCRAGFNGADVKIFASRPGGGGGETPGEVIALHEDGPEIACGARSVVLTEVQTPGKKRMPAAAWLRGRGPGLGDRLT